MNTEEQVEVLNDLVQINNDRIEGYQKATSELKDEKDNDLKVLFSKMEKESRDYSLALASCIGNFGGTATETTTVSGKIYRAWMEVKALFTGGDRKTVLDNCEGGEDAAQAAYETALASLELVGEQRELVSSQKEKLRASHDEIKALRDMQPIAN